MPPSAFKDKICHPCAFYKGVEKGVIEVFAKALPAIAPGLHHFFNDTAATEIYTLSLHDALPISENNEEVFGGKAVPYLRSVPCVTDRQSLAGRDIVTTRTTEPMNASEGRSVTREVALLNVFGFSLPRRVSNHYLHGSLDQDEARNWT